MAGGLRRTAASPGPGIYSSGGPLLDERRTGRGRGAAGGAHAAAWPRRVRRPGAHRRPRLGAARRHRRRRALQHDLLRAAGLRQDHPCAAHRHRDRRALGAALGGQLGYRGRARRDQGRARSAHPRPGAHDPLHRRDPPLQQGAAGRPAAGHRRRRRDAHRRHHREPLLRGQLGAHLALSALPLRAAAAGARGAGRADRAGRRRAGAGRQRSHSGRGRPRLPRRDLARRRARGAQRPGDGVAIARRGHPAGRWLRGHAPSPSRWTTSATPLRRAPCRTIARIPTTTPSRRSSSR